MEDKTQHSSTKQFNQISSVSYLTALSAELILNVMVTECRSLLDAGYCDGCLFFSCYNTKSEKNRERMWETEIKAGITTVLQPKTNAQLMLYDQTLQLTKWRKVCIWALYWNIPDMLRGHIRHWQVKSKIMSMVSHLQMSGQPRRLACLGCNDRDAIIILLENMHHANSYEYVNNRKK